MKTLVIIDYGSGNLHSANKAFERANLEANLGYNIVISNKIEEVKVADKIVVPGVGAFADCVSGIKSSGLLDEIKTQVTVNKKPFLGICVGMQMLADKGYENIGSEGLGLISGEVSKIDLKETTDLKLPHMGWNNLTDIDSLNPLLKNISDKDNFYFVHSYHFKTPSENIIAKVNYGADLTAIVNKENIWGVQFHPEKSQKNGIKLLQNFLHI